MPKRKSKSEKHKKQPKTKISQKVIQQVIVKVGEHKKARRAKRRQTLATKQQLNELMLQQQISDRVSPNVIYQTGAPFQAPSVQPTITDAVREKLKQMKPNYLEIEPPALEPLFPNKRETLANFITPVSVISSTEFPPTSNFASMEQKTASEPVDSKIYSEAGRQQERVEGNYRFGETDESAKAPSALYDNESLTQKPKTSLLFGETLEYQPDLTIPERQEGEEEYVFSAPKSSSSSSQKKERKPKRTPEQILIDKQNELQLLLEQTGMTEMKAFDRSRLFNRKDIQDEIDFAKLNVKLAKKKSKKTQPK